MLATGYFAKTKDYIKAGLSPVSVALRTPAFFKYPSWTNFAPPKELFWKWKSGDISDETYKQEYISFLENTVSESALKKIKYIEENKDVVLCCFEKPQDFCHRHILAEWLEEKLSTLIGEVTIWKF